MGEKLRLLLLESPLELVPRELWSHPQVVKTARRYDLEPGDLILDKSLHYNAMAVLPKKWKRGRPDIVHVTLLNILDSPLAMDGKLEVYIHVFDGRVFRVEPHTRIPKHFERFKGLMAQLLKVGRVPPEGEPLIYEVAGSLSEFLSSSRLILMWERGVQVSPDRVVEDAMSSGDYVGIGMFPRGDFKRSVLRKASRSYSIMGGRPLKAWTVASRLLCAAERMLGYL